MSKPETLLKHIRPWIGHLYVYGGQGHAATEAYIRSRAKAYPSYFTNGRLEYMIKRAKDAKQKGEDLRCFDCSGLYWDAINKSGLMGQRPNGKQWDATAHTTYHTYCVPVKKSQLRAGDLVFYGKSTKITHMAIVGEDGKVYEAAGGAYGVVVNDSVDDRTVVNLVNGKKEKKSAWNYFGRPHIFVEESVHDGTLRLGDTDETTNGLVTKLQTMLTDQGYSSYLGTSGIDGKFGIKTEGAVEAYQTKHDLEADGVVGPATWAALELYYTPEPETQGEIVRCTGNTVNVRSGSGTTHDKLGIATKGQIMLAMEEVDGWREVAIVLEQELVLGYISAKYVEAVEV